ncbi:hypothetical protein CS009_04760 [Streptococcus macedonicus]|uniref:Uncharacterized protein n=1 Tax=Streptococcus macedonicus TaxID=59310 RepID=A0AAP8FYN9_STRMC|nr:hypothetical protein [Streptococcus macedonicus]PHV57648.1 hypothetical protein CS009_04760 [Streptococcus macedonicus]
MNNVRIAIRDSTDSHNVAFFDNEAGIKYKKAEIQRFLAGSASILTLQYNSKDIDTIRTGCKLAFRYKTRDYWLNIIKFEKQGFKVEITACSVHLEMNNEKRGAHKPDKEMSFAEYLAYYDPEHSVTLGINQVSDKKIKLEWTGTDTILARLFSIANSFDAELEFVTELNDDYSLKRHVLNVYKKGNLGSNKTSSPVRVGKELKVINYSDSIEDLRTAVRATGKDGLTIDGLNKKIYDDNKELLYYSSGNTVYAPQSRDRFPSVGQASNDNWIVQDLGETEYETKEALWGYMYGEIQKICLPKIEYKVTGAIDSDVGDTQTLIDDVHYEPPLYLKARVSELTDDILQGKVIDSTFINFERQYSQIADSLLKQVKALAEDTAPYIVRLSTDNGYNFKNGQGTSTITAKLEKYSKIVNANWKWLINHSVVSETSSVKINASQVNGTLNVVAVAIVDGNEVAREYITFTNSDDGVGIKSIKRYYTTNDQAEGVTAGGQNWSTKPTTVTADKSYMWSYDVITYTNDTSLVTEPAVIGARGDDGLDADTTGITEALDKAKQQLITVASDLSTAKQDLQTQASQLQAQANAQSELTKRVSSVEETANGTKTTVSELSKTVDSNTKNISSVTARTKVVEDDLTSTKTTLSQVQTTANSASQKTATLETGLDGVKADLTATTATADTTKTNLANYQASNDKAVANLQSNLQTANGNISSLKTKVEAVPGQITSAVSSVESKIPTSLDSLNLMTGTRDWSTKANKWHMGEGWSTEGEEYQGLKVHSTQKGWNGSHQNIFVKSGDVVTFSFFAKATNTLSRIKVISRWDGSSVYQAPLAGVKESDEEITVTNEWKRYSKTVHITSDGSLQFRTEYNGATIPDGNTFYVAGLKLAKSALDTGYSENPTDAASDINAISSELKQTTDSIKASVSSLDSSTVKTATLNLDNNGFVTKVGKTVNGNTFATMIAQNESDVQIIAKKMKVSGDMIVNGAISAEKLNVSNLSAVNSNLGKIEGGSLLLQENKATSSSIDSWGTFNRPAHKQGLYMDNHGLASSGAIQRKNGGETTPTDMPLAVLKSGELRFLVVDYNDNLENVLHYGLSDPDFGAIRFEIDSELKRRLTMTSSGYLNFQATNYTNWTSTGVSGCEYMIQGRLVLVNYDVTFNSAGTHTIGGIPQEFTKKSLMMTAKAWSVTPRDKNIQLNPDGRLYILDAEANVNYRGTLVFSY